MSDEAPSVKEDVSSERTHFDKYYPEVRDRQDPLLAIRIEKATNPRARPLDYWEYAFRLLGDVRGKNVLEVGCGGGWISRLLAFKGAFVSAFDVSLEGCVSTREKLRGSGLRCDSIAVMDAHKIALKDGAFDAVFIAGVLHHLNTEKAASEIYRVLKPGGRFVCYEPLRYGRMMWALRKLWMRLKGRKEQARTEHEESLQVGDLQPFQRLFAKSLIRRFNFVAKTERLQNRFGTLANMLRWVDYILLSALPPLRRYCTGVVCCFEK